MQSTVEKQQKEDKSQESVKQKKPLKRLPNNKDRVFKFQGQEQFNTFSTEAFTPSLTPVTSTMGRSLESMSTIGSAPKVLYGRPRYDIPEHAQSLYLQNPEVILSPIEVRNFPQKNLQSFDESISFMQMAEEMGHLNLKDTFPGVPPNLHINIPHEQQEAFQQYQQIMLIKQLQQSQTASPMLKMYQQLPAFPPPQVQQVLSPSQPPNLCISQQFMDPDFSTLSPYDQISDDITLSSEIDDLWGNQIVSRKLQKIIESGREDQKDYIISKLERISPQIERDVFGNYVVQKVFEKCNDQQRQRMFNKLRGFFVDLSKNAYGCRVIQKIIEFVQHKEEIQEVFIIEIKDNLRSLILDNNGNYVLHKMLEVLPKERVRFLLPEIESQVNVLVQRNYGCKIILRCFEIYDLSDTIQIQQQVVNQLEILVESEPGNYIVQYLIRRGVLESKKQVKNFILRQFISLSMNKYASNTVEKLVEVMEKDELRYLAQSLMSINPQVGTNIFLQLSVHQYGCYVIKTLLVLSDKEVLKPIISFFRMFPNFMMALQMNVFGQRILQLLTKQNMQI